MNIVRVSAADLIFPLTLVFSSILLWLFLLLSLPRGLAMFLLLG